MDNLIIWPRVKGQVGIDWGYQWCYLISRAMRYHHLPDADWEPQGRGREGAHKVTSEILLPRNYAWNKGLCVTGLTGDKFSGSRNEQKLRVKQAWNAGKAIQGCVIQLATVLDPIETSGEIPLRITEKTAEERRKNAFLCSYLHADHK